jgi:hypothetical protein
LVLAGFLVACDRRDLQTERAAAMSRGLAIAMADMFREGSATQAQRDEAVANYFELCARVARLEPGHAFVPTCEEDRAAILAGGYDRHRRPWSRER